ncbi:MAG: glycoside hydrolase family 25 protein [Candidatus Dojkabacteria bacterium]
MAKGVDISEFQDDVDFDSLKAQVDFVFIRSSFGVGYTDNKFERNKTEARRVGLARGFYHYAYPQYNLPEEEASYFLSVLNDLQKDELMVLDFEESWNGNKVDWCFRFLKLIQNTLGFKPVLYINLNTANSENWTTVVNGDFGLWIALWDNDSATAPTTSWPVVALKQYSSTGSIQGVNGSVDLDVFFGDLTLFKKYGYQPNNNKPSSTPINIKLPVSNSQEKSPPAYIVRRNSLNGFNLLDIFRSLLNLLLKFIGKTEI